MKLILSLLIIMAAGIASAADTNTSTIARWIDSITVAPVGAIRAIDLNGRSEYGAGVDLGVRVNPFVSIHVVNLAFEGPGQTVQDDGRTTGPNSWGGTAVDETDILVRAIISPFSSEKISVYALAGGVHTWGEDQRWGLSAGGGVELRLNKTFSVAGDYSVRMFSEADANGSSLDGLARVLVNLRF